MEAVEVIDEGDLAPDLEAAIRRTLVACFPKDAEFFSRSRAWHGSAPAYSAVICDGAEVIAHLGVVQRRITVGDQSLLVAGIQNVGVRPEHRGRGLCRLVLDAAMGEALERGLDVGLLFCVAANVPVYAQCGWQRLPDPPVVRVDFDGVEKPLADGNLPMWLALAKKSFPDGAVHLGGNDW